MTIKFPDCPACGGRVEYWLSDNSGHCENCVAVYGPFLSYQDYSDSMRSYQKEKSPADGTPTDDTQK